jgi:hypothetical protein
MMHHLLFALQTTAGTAVQAPTPAIAGAPHSAGLDPQVLAILAATIVLIAVFYPIARAIAKRLERGGAGSAAPAVNADSDARIQRLEQSMEAMELELERISEGQRYTTKLLTERLPLAARVPQPGQGEKTLL